MLPDARRQKSEAQIYFEANAEVWLRRVQYGLVRKAFRDLGDMGVVEDPTVKIATRKELEELKSSDAAT